MLLFPFRKLVQVDPWNSSVGRSLFTLVPQPRRSLTCVLLGRFCVQQSLLQDTLPTDLTRAFIWLASSRGQGFRNTSLSRSSIIILTRAIPHHGRGPSLPIWMDNPQGTTAGPPRLCRRQIECFLHIKVCRLALSPFCLRVMLLLPTARALNYSGLPPPRSDG